MLLPLSERLAHCAGALTGRLAQGPGHLLMYTAGRFATVRSLVVWGHGRLRSAALPDYSGTDASLLESVDLDRAVRSIHEDGFCTGLRLRDSVLQEIRAFCESTPCYGNGESKYTFLYSEKERAEQKHDVRFNVGRYSQESLCPTIATLSRDPFLLAIAGRYFGAQPALAASRIWWSFANPSDQFQKLRNAQSFHYDIDGFRTLSFFFYLTDVTESSGSHVCICGTHRRKRLRHLLSPFKTQTDEEIERAYGRDRHVTLCGPAGSGFAEETFCFHKGRSPETADRLVLQLRFGLKGLPGYDRTRLRRSRRAPQLA